MSFLHEMCVCLVSALVHDLTYSKSTSNFQKLVLFLFFHIFNVFFLILLSTFSSKTISCKLKFINTFSSRLIIWSKVMAVTWEERENILLITFSCGVSKAKKVWQTFVPVSSQKENLTKQNQSNELPLPCVNPLQPYWLYSALFWHDLLSDVSRWIFCLVLH